MSHKIIILFFCFYVSNETLLEGVVLQYSEGAESSEFGLVQDIKTFEIYYISTGGAIDQIKKGSKVTFCARDTRRGLEAYNIKLK